MLSITICTIGLLLLNTVPCIAFPATPNEPNLLTTPSLLTNPTLPATGNGGSSLNDLQIDCHESQYGTNLNYDSCLDAFRTFELGSNTNPVQVRKRGTGEGVFAIWLPYRLISGNGVCTIDIVKKGTADFEVTSGAELSRATWKLINKCVRDEGGRGGVASNIGRSATLGIILRSYNPTQVQCSPHPNQHYGFDECHVLLDYIPADVAPLKTWGPRGEPGVDVGLPVSQSSVPPQNCRFRVRAYSAASTVRDQMTHFDAWQAAVALKGMCARFNQGGHFVQMGRNKRLYMTIDDFHNGGSGGGPVEMGNRTQGVNGMGLTMGGHGEEQWDFDDSETLVDQ
ncbi:MAG: hypothetical protein Q9218_007136 [Villophora microphyllina]